jgi:hypothetical protein
MANLQIPILYQLTYLFVCWFFKTGLQKKIPRFFTFCPRILKIGCSWNVKTFRFHNICPFIYFWPKYFYLQREFNGLFRIFFLIFQWKFSFQDFWSMAVLSNVLMYSGTIHWCLWRCGRHHTTTTTTTTTTNTTTTTTTTKNRYKFLRNI